MEITCDCKRCLFWGVSTATVQVRQSLQQVVLSRHELNQSLDDVWYRLCGDHPALLPNTS